MKVRSAQASEKLEPAGVPETIETSAVGREFVASGPASEKYQRILDAAVEVIAEKGYFNAPVSAIAARAGVADGTVYLYFKSKDDVLRTAIDQNFDRFHRQVVEAISDSPRPAGAIGVHRAGSSGERIHQSRDGDRDAD